MFAVLETFVLRQNNPDGLGKTTAGWSNEEETSSDLTERYKSDSIHGDRKVLSRDTEQADTIEIVPK